MIFQFGQYKIDVDVEKTRLFYEKSNLVSEQCSCDGCQNFADAVRVLPTSVHEFFSELGVDLRRIRECYVYHTNEDGSLCYGGFCHICGTLLNEAEHTTDGTVNLDACFSVSSDFHIAFSKDVCLLEKDFPSPVIELNLYANIPWVLEIENSYML